MNIGYRTVGLAGSPIEDVLRTIADAGYDSVELCLENPDLNPSELSAKRVAQLTGLMGELDLKLASISYHGVSDQLEDRRQRTYAAIERLGDFGAEVFIVASRREEPARLPAQWDEAVQLYRELADRCGEHDCNLAVEPQPGLVIRNTEDLVKVLHDCNHPNVGANLDIAHAAITADDLSWAIYQLGTKLVCVHVADVANTAHHHLVPGEGDIDFDEVHEMLDSVDYHGPIVVDIPRTDGDPGEVCRQAYAAFRSHWAV